MKRIIPALILLISSPALAQQMQQQPSPSEFALQASGMIVQLGQLAEAQKKEIETLKISISTLQKQLEETKLKQKEIKP